ncbi:transcriptional regulator [Streptomyces kronopolitis]|uniref:transcriptional regulator n=1 Tax=Streptomyces kronopolitis TaxID=1612435 RepID=UPI003D965F89
MDVSTALEDRHPLNQLLALRGWTNEDYLRRVSAKHRALGYGGLGCRKEKMSRWTRPVRPQVPNEPTQLAMAAVLDIAAYEVRARGWPHWLLLGMRDHSAVWGAPWTPEGTIHALDDSGGSIVDRRGFLTAGAGTVAAAIAQWAIAAPTPANAETGRLIGADVADRFDSRLNDLRHLDDDLGADHVYDAARAEVRFINRLLRNNSYNEATGRRLYASAAEASRLAGWCAYDGGDVAAAEKHLHAALRASASSGDHTVGATVAAFWANVRYGSATSDPRSALDLIDGALVHRARITSPRVLTMLHIRRARAHSLAGESAAAYRSIDDALTVYDNGIPAGDDLPSMYWVNAGEIHQAAASAALSLQDPARALNHFTAAATHTDPYDAEKEPRGTAIYLLRQASAYLVLGDLDGTVETARPAVDLMGGVNSARGSSALAELRTDLARYCSTPVVKDFLSETA